MSITDEAKSTFQEIADDLDQSAQLAVRKDKGQYPPERRGDERIDDSVLDAFVEMVDMTDAFASDTESALRALNQLWEDD